MTPLKPSARRHMFVLAAYVMLGLILTYPLVLHFGTHVPGDGIDDPALAWNLWWVKFALVDRSSNPFACGHMFHPIGINLAFYTLTLLNGLLSVPLQVAINVVSASNVLLLASFALSGYGAYLLARDVLAGTRRQVGQGQRETSSQGSRLAVWGPPFLAGLIYAFSSSKLFYVSLGQFNIASSQWIPFAVLYTLRTERDRSVRSAALAGLFLILQAYAELTFATFLVVFIVLYASVVLLRRVLESRSRTVRRDVGISLFIRHMVVLGVIFGLGIVPFLANMIPDLQAEGDLWTSGGGFVDVFSADLAGLLLPTQLHPLLGGRAAELPFSHDKGQHLYLGYTVMGLAGLAMWRGRRSSVVRFWSIAALLFLLLNLGPTVRVNGHDTGIPGPFALISQVPFFEGNRYPSRYSVMLVLSLAILAAYGLRVLLWGKACGARRRAGRWLQAKPLLAATVAALMLFEHLSIPLPLSDMRIPTAYQRIPSEQDGLAVLELPIGWRNGGRVLGQQDVIIMFEQWYQTAHGGRLLGGNTSRNPDFKFQYFAQAPLLSSIIAVQNGQDIPPDVRAADQAAAADILRFLGVSFVLIHRPSASPELVTYIEEVMPLEQVADEDGVLLYRVMAAPETVARIDLGTPLGRLHLAEGWSPVTDNVQGEAAVWAQRREALLLASLTGAEQWLRFRAWAPRSGQTVEVWATGRRWARLDLDAGWGEYEISLADGAVQPGLSTVHLRFSELYPLADLERTAGQVAGQEIVPAIVVESAGLETGGGDLGHVYVNGQDLSPNQRGYNLVALAPDGERLRSEAFDTHLDPLASSRLAQAIGGLPVGSVVALAVADEASLNLTEEAVVALQSVGAIGDMRDRFRWGHAIIGVKGAPPGQALEAHGILRPSLVHLGIGATAPAVAAAFAEFEFTVPR